jgi:hypothetical protein
MNRYTRLGVIYLVLATILGCTIIVRNRTPTLQEIRRQAYDYAVACALPEGVKPMLKFEEIKWETHPFEVIRVVEGGQVKDFLGFFEIADSTIHITKPLERSIWANAHEATHAIGWYGHSDEPFRRCRLLPDQHLTP